MIAFTKASSLNQLAALWTAASAGLAMPPPTRRQRRRRKPKRRRQEYSILAERSFNDAPPA
jgi:hypothetical protein